MSTTLIVKSTPFVDTGAYPVSLRVPPPPPPRKKNVFESSHDNSKKCRGGGCMDVVYMLLIMCENENENLPRKVFERYGEEITWTFSKVWYYTWLTAWVLTQKILHHSSRYSLFYEWAKIFDRSTPPRIYVVFLDWAKAFDKVNHHVLLKQLHKYGVCGKVLLWIKSLLFNRKQSVLFEGAISDWVSVSSGVPHRSYSF